MKKFIFGFVPTQGDTFYWDGRRLVNIQSYAQRYATRGGIERAISNLKRRGIIPYQNYFIEEVKE